MEEAWLYDSVEPLRVHLSSSFTEERNTSLSC